MRLKGMELSKDLFLASAAALWAWATALFAKYFFDDWEFVGFLGALVFCDTVTGILAAVKNKCFSSKKMGATVYKVLVYSITLIAVHAITRHTVSGKPNVVVGLFVEYLDATLYTFIVLREAVSIHENLKKLGYGLMPVFLEKKISEWLTKKDGE